jgi:putative oxidoreductase
MDVSKLIALLVKADGLLQKLASPLLLAFRLYVAQIFFNSGLIKLANFDSTVSLFTNEYAVPLLPPMVAAVAGTGAELVLPVLLALGIASRFTGVAFFVFNLVAALSYPDISDAGIKDHMLWGAILAVIATVGPGWFAADTWLKRYLKPSPVTV